MEQLSMPEYMNIKPFLSPEVQQKVDPTTQPQHHQLAASLIEEASQAYALGQWTAALRLYDQVVLIDPTNNVLFANRSAILLKLGRAQEAIDEANHSIRLRPDWAKVP